MSKSLAVLDVNEVRQQADLIAELLRLLYLRPEQAAIVATVDTSTIRSACRNGQLAHTRINGGKLIRIATDDLRAWMAANRKAGC
jgi:excisionase family DNA binding protein